MSLKSSEEKLHAFLRGNGFRILIKFGIVYFLWIVLYYVLAFTVMYMALLQGMLCGRTGFGEQLLFIW